MAPDLAIPAGAHPSTNPGGPRPVVVPAAPPVSQLYVDRLLENPGVGGWAGDSCIFAVSLFRPGLDFLLCAVTDGGCEQIHDRHSALPCFDMVTLTDL